MIKERSALVVLFSILALHLMFGTAFAIPTDSSGNTLVNTPGYSWTDNPYWTPTDLTTGSTGSSLFIITLESAAYESDFGLYTVNDSANPTSISAQFEVFSYVQEPGALSTIYFKSDGTGWGISTDNVSYQSFGNVFGFYFAVHSGGQSDASADWVYYSDPQFNSVRHYEQHVAMEWDGISNVKIYLEDLAANMDWDWNDMNVHGNDLAPVPEPATMLLLGTGLIGLAGLGRKRLRKA